MGSGETLRVLLLEQSGGVGRFERGTYGLKKKASSMESVEDALDLLMSSGVEGALSFGGAILCWSS